MTTKYRVKVTCPGFIKDHEYETDKFDQVMSEYGGRHNPLNYPDIFEEVPEPEPESEFVEYPIEPTDEGLKVIAPGTQYNDFFDDELERFPQFVGRKFEGCERVYAYSRGWESPSLGIVYSNDSVPNTVPVTANRAVFRRA